MAFENLGSLQNIFMTHLPSLNFWHLFKEIYPLKICVICQQWSNFQVQIKWSTHIQAVFHCLCSQVFYKLIFPAEMSFWLLELFIHYNMEIPSRTAAFYTMIPKPYLTLFFACIISLYFLQCLTLLIDPGISLFLLC